MQAGQGSRNLTAAAAALALVFLLLPMAAIIPLSFSSAELMTFPPPGYSLRWFEEFFTSSRWSLATRNSLLIAAAASLLATVAGTLAALGLHLGQFRGKAVVIGLLAMPVVTPSIITAAAMFFAFSIIGLTGSLTGLILAHTVIAAPFVVIAVLASLHHFHPQLMRAAASLGAPPGRAFRRVMLPLIAPGVASGAVFAFAASFDEFVISLFLAGPAQFTLPRQMYASVRESLTPVICAAAVMLFFCSMALLIISEAARARGEKRLSAGKRAR